MKKETNINIAMMIKVADEFFEIGQSLAMNIKTDLEEKGFSIMIPAVVNFALATEFYLKIIHALKNSKPSNTHSLWNLFKNLPRDTQIHVEESYKLNILDDNVTSPIKDLLLKHDNSFVEWRHVYEIRNNRKYTFDFNKMNVFCQIIRVYIKHNSNTT